MKAIIIGCLSFLFGSIAFGLLYTIQQIAAGAVPILEGYLISVLSGGILALIVWAWRSKLIKKHRKIEHLNLALRAVRNVSQLLVKERDRASLLQDICEILVENRGYYNVWIALLDESGELLEITATEIGQNFLPLVEQMQHGEFPYCVVKALSASEVVCLEDPINTCTNCPLVKDYANRAALALRLEYEGKVYGFLSASVPREFISEAERDLLKGMGGDVAFALHKLEYEETREKSEQVVKQLAAIVESSEDAIIGKTLDGIIQTWNKGAEMVYGYTPEEIIGKPISILVPPERLDELSQILTRINQGESVDRYETVRIRKDGTRVPVSLTISPIKDSGGKIVGTSTVARDITERKRAEEALRRTVYRLNERVKELNCLYAVSRLVVRPGISFEEMLQGTVYLIPPALQFPGIACARIILEGRNIKTANFKETPWKIAADIMVYGEPSGTLEVCYTERLSSDEGIIFQEEEKSLLGAIAGRLGRITERERAEAALRMREKSFRDLVENSLTGIFIVQEGKIVYKNPEQKRLLGNLSESFNLSDFKNFHPDDVEKMRQFYQRILSGEAQTLDVDFRLYPAGKMDSKSDMLWIDCRASLIEYRGKEAILFNMMDMTRAKEFEHLLTIKDKMTSLGRVAAGIAHEIRNPLSGINIYLDTLEKIFEKADGFEKVPKILGQIQSASSKIESVIKRVMDFSKPSEPKFVFADINHPIGEAIDLSAVSLRKSGIKIEKVLSENLPKCRIDPHLIEAVILNLITNAAEAMKNVNGLKQIEVSSSVMGEGVVVKVSDSGPGVPLNQVDKIFDPFYTTKSDSTGIGLSLNHRIVTDHGGTMSVSKSKWGGAEFIINIPVNQTS
ncbi:MAG: PAS domain S-box protein [Deltaproteobacteria bacterium]|nr:PAS domain S-box protein [Deltaproteobacteria bacterium]MBW2051058.1 PAS domain S-box protein [Deltaproteobacteria bacterium]MBW2141777.1 PAS domain S-box protein [Deltaproteobacteria bacterium]